MSENGIRLRVSKKIKATTNSNHKLPVAENILNRNSSVDKPKFNAFKLISWEISLKLSYIKIVKWV